MTTLSVAARVRGSFRRLLILACLAPLGACASFDGQPSAVLTPAMTNPANYRVPPSLERYYAMATPADRRRERDKIIGIYLAAADSNFLQFKRLLSRESKGSNFALGSAIVGLTSAATVAGERAAEIMSAGAAGLTGVQGKLSTEVYFAKTLPALFAGMEANRTRVRTLIFRRMAEDDSYPLAQAIADVAAYEEAGSIDQAIKTMTAETSERADQEQARFENMIGVGRIVVPAARTSLRDLGNRIDAMVPGRAADLARISAQLNLPVNNVEPENQATNIMLKLQEMAAADPASLDAFVQTMKSQGVDLTI